MKEPSSTTTGSSKAPGFKEVRNYLRNIQQREALGGLIKAGWTPAELGEFARTVFLSNGKTHPTAASYQYATEKGADHPHAVETLASLRAPGFTLPPFNRSRPKKFEWDDPDNPEHPQELRADVALMARSGETARLLGSRSRGPLNRSRCRVGSGSGSSRSAFAITRWRTRCTSKASAAIASPTLKTQSEETKKCATCLITPTCSIMRSNMLG